MTNLMTPEEIEAHFKRADGQFLFARWERPIVPVVFGVEEQTLQILKGAVEAGVALAGHSMGETDPELGVNLMFFFFREWDELLEVPDLGRMIPDLYPLVGRLKAAEANQYRAFRFEKNGAIRACFVFLRMDDELSAVPAEALALGQVVQSLLLWSDQAFTTRSPLAVAEGHTILRPDVAALIRAAYDPTLPVQSEDKSHALRLYARMHAGQAQE